MDREDDNGEVFVNSYKISPDRHVSSNDFYNKICLEISDSFL